MGKEKSGRANARDAWPSLSVERRAGASCGSRVDRDRPPEFREYEAGFEDEGGFAGNTNGGFGSGAVEGGEG